MIQYSPDKVINILKEYDFVCPMPQYCKSVYEQYKINHDIRDVDEALKIIKAKFPDYFNDANEYLKGNKAFYYNMFVFPKSMFFEYCHWIFNIISELEKKIDLTDRRLFISERLTGIYIYKKIKEGKRAKFLPIVMCEGKHEIPVVFSTDQTYVYPLSVALFSLLKYAKINTKYKICVLHNSLSKSQVNFLTSIVRLFDGHVIDFYKVGNKYDKYKITQSFIATPTFYRLSLPEILRSINKCIYLDCDVIVQNDLSELFRLNIDDKYIAGVRAAGYFHPNNIKRLKNELGIPADSYVNAGVLLFNLKKMRANGLSKVFTQLLDKNFHDQDQDIINKACYGKIRILPPQYNLMTKYKPDNDLSYSSSNELKAAYSKEEWDRARKNPCIIHFADKIKPWNDLNAVFCKKWWDVAIELPGFKKIYDAYFPNIINQAKAEKMTEVVVTYPEAVNNYQKAQNIYLDLIKKVKGHAEKINRLQEELRQARNEVSFYKNELHNVKTGYSFRTGRIITWFPRKVRGSCHCLQQHGLVYTFKRFIEHMGIDMNTGDFHKR